MTNGKLVIDLVDQSIFLGEGDRYVQGAGGNISVKQNKVLIIKASGTRLNEAGFKNIFVKLDLEQAQSAVLDRENLSDLVIEDGHSSGLRPSIETAIHSLLPHKFVTHVHAIGAISRSIDKNFSSSITEIENLAKVIPVPYAKPGIPLAREILAALSAEVIDPQKTLIVLLGNHGIIVAGPDAQQIQEIIVQVEDIWAPVGLEIVGNGVDEDGLSQIAPQGTLTLRQSELLCGGALTPDQAVFLGELPFSRKGPNQSRSQVVIDEDGSVWADPGLSSDALEIAKSFILIARATSPECEPNYLSAQQIDELLNWDAEKWRKAQEK